MGATERSWGGCAADGGRRVRSRATTRRPRTFPADRYRALTRAPGSGRRRRAPAGSTSRARRRRAPRCAGTPTRSRRRRPEHPRPRSPPRGFSPGHRARRRRCVGRRVAVAVAIRGRGRGGSYPRGASPVRDAESETTRGGKSAPGKTLRLAEHGTTAVTRRDQATRGVSRTFLPPRPHPPPQRGAGAPRARASIRAVITTAISGTLRRKTNGRET